MTINASTTYFGPGSLVSVANSQAAITNGTGTSQQVSINYFYGGGGYGGTGGSPNSPGIAGLPYGSYITPSLPGSFGATATRMR